MIASELNVRITIIDPPVGVMASLHDRKSRPVQAQVAREREIHFDLSVRLRGGASDGRYSGEFVRTADGRRYIYVAWGQLAGQADSCWERRAKIMLESLDPVLANAALKEGKRLEARINGTAPDGSPVCGRVPAEWRTI